MAEKYSKLVEGKMLKKDGFPRGPNDPERKHFIFRKGRKIELLRVDKPMTVEDPSKRRRREPKGAEPAPEEKEEEVLEPEKEAEDVEVEDDVEYEEETEVSSVPDQPPNRHLRFDSSEEETADSPPITKVDDGETPSTSRGSPPMTQVDDDETPSTSRGTREEMTEGVLRAMFGPSSGETTEEDVPPTPIKQTRRRIDFFGGRVPGIHSFGEDKQPTSEKASPTQTADRGQKEGGKKTVARRRLIAESDSEDYPEEHSSGEPYEPPKDVQSSSTEGEQETPASEAPALDERGRERKRRPAARRRIQSKSERRSHHCPVEGCKGRVQYLKRHFDHVHPNLDFAEYQQKKAVDKVESKRLSFRGLGHLRCPKCGSSTRRLDLHLVRLHRIDNKSKEFEDVIKAAQEPESIDDPVLSEAIEEYKESLIDRSDGTYRSAVTADTHVTAVKTFLERLTCDDIEALAGIGKKGGKIDTFLEEKRLKPESLRVYLHILAKFLGFLAGEAKWKRKLRVTTDMLNGTATKMRNISASLMEDVNRQAVAAHAAGLDELKLEEWMVAAYLQSSRVQRIRTILKGDHILSKEKLEARDCLVVQLLLTNAKRAGDITHIKAASITDATIKEGEDQTEFYVAEHKGAKSGKKCSIILERSLLDDLKLYASKCWTPASKEEYLFLNRSGKAITPSTMSKLVNKEWESFSKSEKLDLPKLTASINRKLAVTALREAEGSRAEQEHLARHMAHNITTADRYYDRAMQKEGRVAALQKVQGRYQQDLEKRQEGEFDEAAAAAVSSLKQRDESSDNSDSD